jgi:hypothetical protein
MERHDAKRRAGLSQRVGPISLVIGVILLMYLCTMLGMNGLAGVQFVTPIVTQIAKHGAASPMHDEGIQDLASTCQAC